MPSGPPQEQLQGPLTAAGEGPALPSPAPAPCWAGRTVRTWCPGPFGEVLPPMTGKTPGLDPNIESLYRPFLRCQICGLQARGQGCYFFSQSSHLSIIRLRGLQREGISEIVLAGASDCRHCLIPPTLQVSTLRPRDMPQASHGRIKAGPSHCEVLPPVPGTRLAVLRASV